MFIIAWHLDTWPTCAVVVMTIVSDHQHTAISLHDEQGHALLIARLLLQDLLHGTHFWLLFKTLTHVLLSVVDLRLVRTIHKKLDQTDSVISCCLDQPIQYLV